LPSWNEGETKARIVTFVQAVTDKKSKDYVPRWLSPAAAPRASTARSPRS
jgi:hypothetical protein